ncbi:MAG: 23S rRNA (adenine(2503)-C(2))-methyltransferase RlmN [Myxococcales bacterium]|nr:23S rRNA (adenine(2503)-C(2))-methyltransferase RlmN [Myxococcales bacterium]
MSAPTDIRSLTLAQLGDFVSALGLPAFRARQIFAWVHARGVTSTDEMTDLSKALRAELAERIDLAPLAVDAVQRSSDGTRKLALRCHDGQRIESVLIPTADRLTQCISSQVGCALGCRFCATATMGIRRNLTPGEIVDQVYRARALLDAEREAGTWPPAALPTAPHEISNLVFMGMGEPMANLDNVLAAVEILGEDHGANFSSRRITVSTVGLVPGIETLGQKNRHVGLAISLHATSDDVRDDLMPVNKRWPLDKLMAALRRYPLPRRRRITFEYVLLAGINDTPADAKRLPKLLDGIPAKLNLLPYNPCRADQPDLLRPDDAAVEGFAEALRRKGINTTVRKSRGLDIDAACGQLVLQNPPRAARAPAQGAASS